MVVSVSKEPISVFDAEQTKGLSEVGKWGSVVFTKVHTFINRLVAIAIAQTTVSEAALQNMDKWMTWIDKGLDIYSYNT